MVQRGGNWGLFQRGLRIPGREKKKPKRKMSEKDYA